MVFSESLGVSAHYFFALRYVTLIVNRGILCIMENISFETQIDEADLFKFNWHHALTQRIFSVTMAGLLLVVLALRFNTLPVFWRLAYIAFAVIILFYMPLTLKTRAKLQMQQEVFKYPINYQFKDSGIVVSSPASEEPAELPWEYVYQVSTWKNYLLIYSNRVNAYIIPKEDIKDVYDPAVSYIKNHVEDYKLKIK